MIGGKKSISCREIFKKFNILPLASEYIMSNITVCSRHTQKFHTNSEIYSRNIRQKHDFLVLNSNLTRYQNGVYCSQNKLFHALPPNIKMLRHYRKAFTTAQNLSLSSLLLYGRIYFS